VSNFPLTGSTSSVKTKGLCLFIESSPSNERFFHEKRCVRAHGNKSIWYCVPIPTQLQERFRCQQRDCALHLGVWALCTGVPNSEKTKSAHGELITIAALVVAHHGNRNRAARSRCRDGAACQVLAVKTTQRLRNGLRQRPTRARVDS